MTTATMQRTTPVYIQPQQDWHGFFREHGDTYSTVITSIPGDDTLTKEEYRRRYETLTKEFRDRLIDVANKASKLSTLVSFVYTIKKARLKRKRSYDEVENLPTAEDKKNCRYPVSKEAEIVTESIIYSRKSPTDPSKSHNINGQNETVKDAAAGSDYTSRNVQILAENIPWLNIPFLAVERNNFEILDMCIKTGVDLETFRNLTGMTLLACSLGKTELNHEILNVLLEHIGVNICTIDGETPLNTCIRNEGISVKEKIILLQKLIDAGADIRTRSSYRETILHLFIRSLETEVDISKMAGWENMIDILLAKGIDINAVDFIGQSALMAAVGSIPHTELEVLSMTKRQE